MQPPLGETGEEATTGTTKKEENYLDKTAGMKSIGSVTLKTGSEQN